MFRMCASIILVFIAAMQPDANLFAQSSAPRTDLGCIGPLLGYGTGTGTTYGVGCMTGANGTAYRLWCNNGKVLDGGSKPSGEQAAGPWMLHGQPFSDQDLPAVCTNPTASSPGTPVCLVAVPIAIKNLANLANAQPANRDAALVDINHLIERYCRTLDRPVASELADGIFPLSDSCSMLTGLLDGVQVYWVSCQ